MCYVCVCFALSSILAYFVHYYRIVSKHIECIECIARICRAQAVQSICNTICINIVEPLYVQRWKNARRRWWWKMCTTFSHLLAKYRVDGKYGMFNIMVIFYICIQYFERVILNSYNIFRIVSICVVTPNQSMCGISWQISKEIWSARSTFLIFLLSVKAAECIWQHYVRYRNCEIEHAPATWQLFFASIFCLPFLYYCNAVKLD